MTIKIREPGSAITHLIAVILTAFFSTPLLIKAALHKSSTVLFSMCVFIASMLLLYSASTLYHSVNVKGKVLKIFKRLDHTMIFVLIAGSYTPICLTTLRHSGGLRLLTIIWSIAIIGMIFKLFWVTCPKWLSSCLYISMGWVCIAYLKDIIQNMPITGFLWLLFGGIIYTIGGVIYALKLPLFNKRHKYFGSHEIFHLFVMAGSMCHAVLMYQYIA